MNFIGCRYICFDVALARGIPLNGYSGWFYYRKWEKGTYREKDLLGDYKYMGYGIDK